MGSSWTPQSGEIVGGRYRLLTHLGRGSMGTVFRAEHVSLGSKAAVKVIDPQLVDRVGSEELEELEERFLREAMAAAALDSAHVVRVLDYGIERGSPYIAMELLEGETLADLMDRVRVLSPSHTFQIMSEVGKAIAKGHAAGIVHRDLKPENIFLAQVDDTIVAKVLDFGIAKIAKNTVDTASRSTRRGEVIGTPSYMSPEQIVGSRTIDGQVDIWALAIITFECLLGRLPFEEPTVGGLALQICGPDRPKPSDLGPVPSGFDAWWERASKREPKERFRDVREAIDALRVALEAPSSQRGSLPMPPAESTGERRTKADRRANDAPAGPSSEPSHVRSTQQTMSAPSGQRATSGLLWVGLLVGIGGALLTIGLVVRSTQKAQHLSAATATATGQLAAETAVASAAVASSPSASASADRPPAPPSASVEFSSEPAPVRTAPPAATAAKPIRRPKADPRLGL